MSEPTEPSPSRQAGQRAGLAVLYVIWGSTPLGIKFAVETLPPFLMAGVRFLLAGLVLYLWLRFQGLDRPSLAQWRSAAVSGALLLLGGNGLVTWGQQTVPSGTSALIIGTTPIWMVAIGWLFDRRQRPGWPLLLGLVAGFGGVALLIDPSRFGGPSGQGLAFLAILAAPVLWTVGSLRPRHGVATDSPLYASALQMLAGGGLMVAAGTLLGEWSLAATRDVSARSAAAFAYLTLAGSLVGFSTYTWLLRVASPAVVSTYAYVNPLVAVFLGWLFGGEGLDANVLFACVLIVGAVVAITLSRRPDRPPDGAKPEAEP